MALQQNGPIEGENVRRLKCLDLKSTRTVSQNLDVLGPRFVHMSSEGKYLHVAPLCFLLGQLHSTLPSLQYSNSGSSAPQVFSVFIVIIIFPPSFVASVVDRPAVV